MVLDIGIFVIFRLEIGIIVIFCLDMFGLSFRKRKNVYTVNDKLIPIVTFGAMLYYLCRPSGSLDNYQYGMVLVLIAKQTYFFDM